VVTFREKVAGEVSKAAERAIGAGATAAKTAALRAYQRDPEGTMAVAKEFGKRAFMVTGAAALGYAIGNAITSFAADLAPDERKLRLANVYRAARAVAAARLGRPLTASEVAAMGETFKRAVAQVDAGHPLARIGEWIRKNIATPS
jgi:hypothetical protein